METKRKHDLKKPIACGAGIVCAVLFSLIGVGCEWFSGLGQNAVWALGILIGCIIWWVFGAFPEFVTALIMAIAFITICRVPTEVAFSAFASSTWWLLVAAFALGLGMQRSGLMARMADSILRVFPKTFKMQAAGLMASGILIGPFIPSLSAKAVMLAPLSLGISDSLGYARQGREATGLFLAMFTGIRNIGPAVISASIIGYGLLATLPSEVAARFDMIHWFVAMLPWLIIVTVLCYLAIVVVFAPRNEAGRMAGRKAGRKADRKTGCAMDHETRYESKSAIAIKGEAENVAKNETEGMAQGEVLKQSDEAANQPDETTIAAGDVNDSLPCSASGKRALLDKTQKQMDKTQKPMNKAQKRMSVIMVCCIGLWITEPLHGIASHIVAIAAMCAMLVFGVVKPKDLRDGVAWESLIFIGIALGLASVFAELGIDEWVVSACQPLFESLAANAYLLIFGICVMTILLRFIIVSEMAYINIFMAFMVPLALALGINPWVIGVCIYAVVNPWFVLYQNPIYLSAYYATEEKMPNQGMSAAFCVLYLAICIIGLMASVPYWRLLGIL